MNRPEMIFLMIQLFVVLGICRGPARQSSSYVHVLLCKRLVRLS